MGWVDPTFSLDGSSGQISVLRFILLSLI